MSEELFAVPQGGKPALLQAREELVQAEGKWLAAVNRGDFPNLALAELLKAVEVAEAKVRRLELEAFAAAKARAEAKEGQP